MNKKEGLLTRSRVTPILTYTEAELLAFGFSELIQEVLRLQEENKTLLAERGYK